MTKILGLDIGGANLKVAHSDGSAMSRPFALWRAPGDLAGQLRSLMDTLPPFDRLAVTMTGELCDCFPTRPDGVRHILQAVQMAAGTKPVSIWTTEGHFVDLDTAGRDPGVVASANWLALAHVAARQIPRETGLLIDVGSTTTDMIYLERGVPRPRGWTDRARLLTGELVYTGVRRTPVSSVLGMEVVAETFATMLDAYLVLGDIPDQANDTDTADGRPATQADARARLARMIGADLDDVPPTEIDRLATRAIQKQADHVSAALDQVLTDRPVPQFVYVAGSGQALAARVVSHPRLKAARVTNAYDENPTRATSACAHAMVQLATEIDPLQIPVR